jgi:hypothetical protein
MSVVAEKPSAVQTIFREVQKLSPPEVEELGLLVFDLQVNQGAWRPETEAELVDRIKNWAPTELRDRCRELRAKRRSDTITDAEYGELLALGQQLEMLGADRLRRLIDLAKLRNTTLDELVALPEFAPSEL